VIVRVGVVAVSGITCSPWMGQVKASTKRCSRTTSQWFGNRAEYAARFGMPECRSSSRMQFMLEGSEPLATGVTAGCLRSGDTA
jgi:hypothetical protein